MKLMLSIDENSPTTLITTSEYNSPRINTSTVTSHHHHTTTTNNNNNNNGHETTTNNVINKNRKSQGLTIHTTNNNTNKTSKYNHMTSNLSLPIDYRNKRKRSFDYTSISNHLFPPKPTNYNNNNLFNSPTTTTITTPKLISQKEEELHLTDLREYLLNNMLPYEKQVKLLEWIITLRNIYCPLHSFNPSSRSINTLIDGFSSIGHLPCTNFYPNSTNTMNYMVNNSFFDRVIALEQSKSKFQAMEHNLFNLYHLNKNQQIECINDHLLNWLKLNYHSSKLNNYKAIIYLDYIYYTFTKYKQATPQSPTSGTPSAASTTLFSNDVFNSPKSANNSNFDIAATMINPMNSVEDYFIEMIKEIIYYHCPLIVVRLPYLTNQDKLQVKECLQKLKEFSKEIIENINIHDNNLFIAIIPKKSMLCNVTLNGDNHEMVPSIQSKRQFEYIWYHGDEEVRERFKHLLTKQMLKNCPEQQELVLNHFIKIMEKVKSSKNRNTNNTNIEELDDQYIYDELFKLFQNEIFTSKEYIENGNVNVTKLNIDNNIDVTNRVTNRVNGIMEMIPENVNIQSLVDIGCSEGSITSTLGKRLSLHKDHVHGCDVRDIGKLYTTNFTFTLLNENSNTLPFPSNSQTLVICLMSLHHINNVQETINEISRILQPGGCLIIREHDSYHKDMNVVLDILHGLYSLVWSNPRETPNFCEDYYCNYKSKQEWDLMIEESGLFKVKEMEVRENNPYLYFYTTYMKL